VGYRAQSVQKEVWIGAFQLICIPLVVRGGSSVCKRSYLGII